MLSKGLFGIAAFAFAFTISTPSFALTQIPGGMKYETQNSKTAVLLDTPFRNDQLMLEKFSLAIKGVYGDTVSIRRSQVDLVTRNGKTGLTLRSGNWEYYFLPFKNEQGQMFAFSMWRE